VSKTHKDQHYIPRSYLRAWADPTAPAGYEPYVHFFCKDGAAHVRKAPKNLFSEADLYTLKMPSGDRDLRLEQGFAGLEGAFSTLRKEFLEQRRQLPAVRYAKLMLFVAAMHNRTPSRLDFMLDPWREMRSMGREVEKWARRASPTELKAAPKNPSQDQDLSLPWSRWSNA
jgi:hypothetical protein